MKLCSSQHRVECKKYLGPILRQALLLPSLDLWGLLFFPPGSDPIHGKTFRALPGLKYVSSEYFLKRKRGKV